MGSAGHTIDNCNAFKYKVQQLIDLKAITFTPTIPNVKANPMPTHARPYVSAIEEANNQELIERVEKIHTLISDIEQLLNHGMITLNRDDCKDCVSNAESCEKLKNCVQQLIDQGTIQIGCPIKEGKKIVMMDVSYPTPEVYIPITPWVIQIPASFPYESMQAKPQRHVPKVYKQGQENQPLVTNEPNVTNIASPEGMTRNG